MVKVFKKGDVVVLKSGGPPMVVGNVPGEKMSSGRVYIAYGCKWFKGTTRQLGWW